MFIKKNEFGNKDFKCAGSNKLIYFIYKKPFKHNNEAV